jgi:hypothetical protein
MGPPPLLARLHLGKNAPGHLASRPDESLAAPSSHRRELALRTPNPGLAGLVRPSDSQRVLGEAGLPGEATGIGGARSPHQRLVRRRPRGHDGELRQPDGAREIAEGACAPVASHRSLGTPHQHEERRWSRFRASTAQLHFQPPKDKKNGGSVQGAARDLVKLLGAYPRDQRRMVNSGAAERHRRRNSRLEPERSMRFCSDHTVAPRALKPTSGLGLVG